MIVLNVYLFKPFTLLASNQARITGRIYTFSLKGVNYYVKSCPLLDVNDNEGEWADYLEIKNNLHRAGYLKCFHFNANHMLYLL